MERICVILGKEDEDMFLYLDSSADDFFDFPDRDHRQDADENEKEREEKAETTDQGADLDDGGRVHGPARRQKVAVQRGDDDHETLEPHPHIDQN